MDLLVDNASTAPRCANVIGAPSLLFEEVGSVGVVDGGGCASWGNLLHRSERRERSHSSGAVAVRTQVAQRTVGDSRRNHDSVFGRTFRFLAGPDVLDGFSFSMQ